MTNQVARRDNAGREFGVICLSVSVCVLVTTASPAQTAER